MKLFSLRNKLDKSLITFFRERIHVPVNLERGISKGYEQTRCHNRAKMKGMSQRIGIKMRLSRPVNLLRIHLYVIISNVIISNSYIHVCSICNIAIRHWPYVKIRGKSKCEDNRRFSLEQCCPLCLRTKEMENSGNIKYCVRRVCFIFTKCDQSLHYL